MRAGETVLVHGAAGGVGTATLQVAKGLRRPHHRRGLDRGEGRAFARAAGADEVVLLDGFQDRGQGADRRPGRRRRRSTWSAATCSPTRCAASRTQGRLLVVGFAAGQGIPEVKVNRLLLNNIDVRGVGWGAFAMTKPGYMQRAVGRPAADDRVGGRRAADRRDVRPRRTSAAPCSDLDAAPHPRQDASCDVR